MTLDSRLRCKVLEYFLGGLRDCGHTSDLVRNPLCSTALPPPEVKLAASLVQLVQLPVAL